MTDLVEILRELRLRLKGTVGSDHWACGKRSGLKQAINIISLPRKIAEWYIFDDPTTALEQSTLPKRTLQAFAAAVGKQVLLNDEHYADACNNEAATAIAYAMNSVFLAKLGQTRKPDPACDVCKGVVHEPNCSNRR